MKIELNIEGSQLDNDVKNILGNLSDKQKNQMAENILTKTLNDCESRMKVSIAREKALKDTNEKFETKYILEEGKLKSSNWSSPSYDHREFFDKRVKDYCDVGMYFKEYILESMLEHGKSLVSDVVKSSPLVTEAVSEASEKLREMMPKIVHDAMVCYFSSQITNVMMGVSSSLMMTNHNTQLLEELKEKLNQGSHY